MRRITNGVDGAPARRRRAAANPLRRRSDQVERAARLVALTVFVLTIPIGIWLGARSYAAGERVMRSEAASRQQVVATVIDGTAGTSVVAPGGAYATAAFAAVQWRGPDGTYRSGYARIPADTVAGSTVPLWTDQSGQLIDQPVTRLEVLKSAVGAGVGVVAAGAVVLLLGLALLRWRLDRARIRAWDVEWAVVAPTWTRFPHSSA